MIIIGRIICRILTLHCIFTIIFIQLFLPWRVDAMGNKNYGDRDKGIIGEKKTRQGRKVYYDQSSGATYTIYQRGATRVTPVVIGDTAHFEVALEYDFAFPGIGWKYSAQEGRFDLNKEGRPGWIVNLASPNKKLAVNIKVVDLFANAELNPPATEEQRNTAKVKAVDDPIEPEEERILAARQAIEWAMKNELSQSTCSSITTPTIGNKKFVKAEVDINKPETNLKKCEIWALNYWAYRENPENRRILIWIATIRFDPTDATSIDMLQSTRKIFETLKFDRNQTAYSDLK